MAITKVPMTRPSYEKGNNRQIRMVVLHATAGKYAGDYNWLKQGGGVVGGKDNPVSIHYYIDKKGNVTQMVDDADIAWQAGVSQWTVDGKAVSGCNPISVGLELENLNTGRDPYPQAQYDATLALTKQLVAKYNIPRNQLVRHLDISPGRKTDPAGFPWAKFVSEVYAPVATPVAGETPTPAPLPADQQLRLFLIDLAYRAAASSAPPGWPLLKATVSRTTGMPIAILSTASTQGDSDSESDPTRPLVLAGQPALLVEAYGRDLYYAPADAPSNVQRLSETPAGTLRDALLAALFKQVDPAQGFHSDWAFHQAFIASPAAVGVPLGPNHKVAGQTTSGQQYVCQHFAVDTLCSPVNQWSKVIKLSDLTRDMYSGDPHTAEEKELRALLLNDLYQVRTGRAFDGTALFCRYAIMNNLGAPTAAAEVQTLEGRKLVAMPYALDVLYCRIPADGRWEGIAVGVLDAADEAGLAKLTSMLTVASLEQDAAQGPGVLGIELTADEVLPEQTYSGGVLGETSAAPHITDLTVFGSAASEARGDATIQMLVVFPSAGKANVDLAAMGQPDAATTYHYYVGTDGAITKLVDEELAARAATGARWGNETNVNGIAVAVGVEGAALGEIAADSPQATSVRWLMADIASRYSLRRDQIIQSADLVTRMGGAWDSLLPAE